MKRGEDDHSILHFSGADAQPTNTLLALDTHLEILSSLSCVERPHLLFQVQLNSSEVSVLLPLLETFPYHCSYEMMYAFFFSRSLSLESLRSAERHLGEARRAGFFDQEMGAVRNALSRVRQKLRPFGIDILSILEEGYFLMFVNRTITGPGGSMRSVSRSLVPRGVKQENTEEEILHFSMQGLLPGGHTLVVNTALGTLSLLICKQDRPHMLMEQQFTTSEMYILMPLLDSYPYYCPYEVLLASFTSGKVTEKVIARCRQRLQEAAQAGVWDQEMRPVRNVLSRARLKTRTLGIEISSILETGYILMNMGRHDEESS